MTVDARTPPPAQDSTAPPTRRDPQTNHAPGTNHTAGTAAASVVSEVLPSRRGRLAPGRGGGQPPSGGRARHGARSRLPAMAPRQRAPRDGRWWAGAAVLTVSLLLLGFVGHVALFSTFQHHRAQTLGYQVLRTSLAKAETPVGQLDLNEGLVAAGTPVALLQIPAIGLSEVVQEGSTAQVLRSGPGHRRDSVMPGQAGTTVILGRQATYGGPFGSLEQLVPGADVTLTTGQGVFTYTVFGLRRAGDAAPEPLRSGAGRLELLTADGLALFPSGVLHVDAELTSTVASTPTRVMSYPALPTAERAMGQDSGAWFTVFFALVFFAAAGIGTWWLWTTWGRWHAWLVGVPVLLALGVACADAAMNALPNLL